MIQHLMNKYREELNTFFDKVNVADLEKLFALCQSCQGMLIFSGIGKSALVAEKIAVTMTATGTRAIFIPPIEAMHGDVGIISPQDIFIAISKSGETEELLNLLPYVRNKGAKIVALTSNARSRLAEAADFQVVVPFHQELCPFNMAPTISTSCQTILGDILAIALMESKNFTLDEYAMNHPAGTIGKRITVKVRNLMIEGALLPLCNPSDQLINVLVELSDKKAGCVLVVDENKKLLGIFTDGDLRRALQKFGPAVMNQSLLQLMTQSSRFTHPEVLAWEALKMMENPKSPITVLPVLNEVHQVMGLLRLHDILQSGI